MCVVSFASSDNNNASATFHGQTVGEVARQVAAHVGASAVQLFPYTRRGLSLDPATDQARVECGDRFLAVVVARGHEHEVAAAAAAKERPCGFDALTRSLQLHNEDTLARPQHPLETPKAPETSMDVDDGYTVVSPLASSPRT